MENINHRDDILITLLITCSIKFLDFQFVNEILGLGKTSLNFRVVWLSQLFGSGLIFTIKMDMTIRGDEVTL